LNSSLRRSFDPPQRKTLRHLIGQASLSSSGRNAVFSIVLVNPLVRSSKENRHMTRKQHSIDVAD
jgi:hypothetical protein